MKLFLYSIFIIFVLTLFVSYTIKIGTDFYCSESPVFRWRFGIYIGECNDETGCHFSKLENNGILEYFGIKKINCLGQDICKIKHTNTSKNYISDTLANTTTVSDNEFVREYSADSSEIYESKFKDINGCKKVVEWKMYDENFNLKSEWVKKYKIDSNQTCDFSAYIIKKKNYSKGKIKEVKEYFANSDESKEEPCGIWEYFDNKGKEIKIRNYRKCEILNFK